MSFKHINKVGVEIEGGWDYQRDDLIPDGSISRDYFSEKSPYVGELVSKPLATKEEVFEFVGTNWPTEVIDKCGYHIHFSLKNINFYSECMNPVFYQEFLNRMEKWGKDFPCDNKNFWNRLNDLNRYCRRSFYPEAQIKHTSKSNSGSRYTHLNYCYGLHKTIECRLFPAFKTAKTAISASEALFDFIEDYLERHPGQNYIRSEELIEDDFSVRENNQPELGIQIKNLSPKLKRFNYFTTLKNRRAEIHF